MRLPEYGTNPPYLVDFIPICLCAKFLDYDEIRRKYLEDGLSPSQIAKEFRVSRTVILARLRDMGIEKAYSSEQDANPQNYRRSVTPYGYKVESGQLIPSKPELQICKLIVDMVQRKGKTHSETARELTRRGFKNRAGSQQWDSKTIFNIYKRWHDKI